MIATDARVKLFKFKNLMVTLLPDLKNADGSTVGSCTSEHDRRCQVSTEILELTPYSHIDPPYLAELRVLLDHALARSRVSVPNALDLVEIEKRLVPQRPEDIDTLEHHLEHALAELRAQREQIDGFIRKNPGWIDQEDDCPEETKSMNDKDSSA
jgi:hypothetical protein